MDKESEDVLNLLDPDSDEAKLVVDDRDQTETCSEKFLSQTSEGLSKSFTHQPKISGFASKMTKKQLETFNIALTRMLLACDIPIEIIDTSQFKNVLKLANPAIILISSSELKEKCIEEVSNFLI